jgi:hypothetical protein
MAELDERLDVIIQQIAHDWGAIGLARLISLASKRLTEMLERLKG